VVELEQMVNLLDLMLVVQGDQVVVVTDNIICQLVVEFVVKEMQVVVEHQERVMVQVAVVELLQ
tara:strand:- start:316 stop:507 length:192 start_codon:yes stop_codon:yes gene_type:complete